MKTKLPVLILLLTFSSPSWAQAGSVQRVIFDKSDFVISERDGFNKVDQLGTFFTAKVGAPELPVKSFSFIVPPNVKIIGVKVVSANKETLKGDFYLYPKQEDVPIGQAAPFVQPDQEVYTSNHPYPGKIVELAGDGYMGGNHLVNILVYPLEYIPAQRKLNLYTDISFEIQYESAQRDYVKPLRMTEKYKHLYGRVLEKTVKNADELELFKAHPRYEKMLEEEGLASTEAPSPLGTPVEYVVITNEEMAPAFQKLADWKTMKGTNTMVKTLSWIRENYLYGSDVQENIRNFIKDAYVNWGTVWVLLGGDVDIIPPRYIYIPTGEGYRILTDYYYSCLDGNWNGDRDNLFGELSVDLDSVDLYPDVFVGRVPVRDTVEVNAFIDKLFSYEKESPYSDFQTKALFLSSEMYFEGDGELLCDTVATYFPEYFTKNELYEYVAEDGIDSINTGYNIIVNYSHSSSFSNFISRYSPRQVITNANIDDLSNTNRYSVMLNVTCSNNQLDLNCLSKHFMTSSSGGGVAYFGSTLGDYPFSSISMHWEFFDQLFNENEVSVGKAFALSKFPLIPHAWHSTFGLYLVCSYLLLGDPEMEIWTQTPSEFSVTCPESLSQGLNWWVSVTVEENSAPVENALVCFKKDNNIYRQALTNSEGTASFGAAVFIETPGEASFVVSKPGFLPADTVVPVVENGPALRTDGIVIDDDSVGSSLGNSDGEMDAGEDVELLITVKNCGDDTAFSVQLMLAQCDTLVVPDYEYIQYGDIAPESSYTPEEKFVLHVSPNCPDQHMVNNFQIQMQHQSSNNQEYYRFMVNAPILAQDMHKVDDDTIGESNGNDNGVVENDETIELPLSIHNQGRASIDGVWAMLTTNDTLISLVRDSAYYGRIDFDQWVFGESSFVFTSHHDNEDTIEFTLQITDGYDRVTEQNFKILPTSSPTDLSHLPYAASIDLSWSVPGSQVAMAGYHLYRGTAQDSLSRVNTSLIRNASYYHNYDLTNNTTYYYEVTTVDSSGNESPRSGLLVAATNPPRKDGWPPQTIFGKNDGSAVLVDLDDDGNNDLLIPSYKGLVYAWKADGSELIDGDNDPSTEGIFAIAPDTTKADFWWATPAVGDLDQDGYQDVVVASYGQDHKIYAWTIDGDSTAFVPGWPRSFGSENDTVTVYASPCLADLDADGELEVIAIVNNYNYDDSGVVHVWRNDGTGFMNGDSMFASFEGGWNFSAPAIGDLNGDGTYEIVVGTTKGLLYAWDTSGTTISGFPVTLEADGDERVSAPLVADIDQTFPGLEIVVVSGGNKVHVIHNDGSEMSNWPFVADIPPPYYGTLPLSVGDVDSDGEWEIVCNLSMEVYALESNGDTVSGWPAEIPNSWIVGQFSTPVVADIDGDDSVEIIVAACDNRIYAFEGDGSQFKGFPLPVISGISTTPVIGKLSSGSGIDLIAGAKDSVYAWNLNGTYDWENVHWGTLQHDLHRTGNWWGTEPEVSQISIPDAVCRDSDTTVSVTVSDPDTQIGDSLSFDWSVGEGSITGSGASVTYHAPAIAPIDPITITVVVSDKGGNAVSRSEEFYVVDCGPGCPFVYPWTGEGFEEDNTILAACELKERPVRDVTDYYLLKKPLVSKDDCYHLEIREFEQERSYLDNFELLVVDHPVETKVGVTPDGHIFSYDREISPVSCVDGNGEDQLASVINQDRLSYACTGAGHLVLTFGPLQELPPDALLAPVKPPPSGKKVVGGSPDAPLSAILEVLDANGHWIRIRELPPRANPDFVFTILDTKYLDSDGRLKFRISWQDHYSADWIALIIADDDDLPTIHKPPLISAIHSAKGEVSHLLSELDGGHVTLAPDESIELVFSNVEERTGAAQGLRRDFVLRSRGYYVKLSEESTEQGTIPGKFSLLPNYPNPFNLETTIKYALPTEAKVKLAIYNLLGQKVRTLVDAHEPAGYRAVSWDGKNDKGKEVASGIYFYKIKAGNFVDSKKMVILK